MNANQLFLSIRLKVICYQSCFGDSFNVVVVWLILLHVLGSRPAVLPYC